MTVSTGSSGPGTKHPIKIFANIFISFIGAGVLGLPFAFKEAGIIEGTVIMSLVGIISVKAMLLLINCKYRILEKHKPPMKKTLENGSVNPTFDKSVEKESLLDGEEKTAVDMEIEKTARGFQRMSQHRKERKHMKSTHKSRAPDKPVQGVENSDLSYGDVGSHAIGNKGRLLVEIAIVVSQTGFCCAYIIFITENLSAYFPSMKTHIWLLILLPPLCLLTLTRHLGGLAMTSLLAQLSNLFAFAVVLWFDFEHLHNLTVHPKKMKIEGLPFFLAISIYCYEGAGMILSLESSLSEEVRHKFTKFFVSTMVIVTTMYISFGSCGYASFGRETNQIITLNLPKGDSVDFAMIVKSCLCLALFFTYPVMMFPVMQILDGYLIWEPEKNMCKGNILRVSMVLMTGMVVLMIPSFSNIMALVGATCCTLLAFTLPGLFHLAIFRGSLTKCEVSFDWFLVGLGLIGAVIGTLDALKRMASPPPIPVLPDLDSYLANASLVSTMNPPPAPPPPASLPSLVANITASPILARGSLGANVTGP